MLLLHSTALKWLNTTSFLRTKQGMSHNNWSTILYTIVVSPTHTPQWVRTTGKQHVEFNISHHFVV